MIDLKKLREEVHAGYQPSVVVVFELLDMLEAAQKMMAEQEKHLSFYSNYDEIICEIDRRADKEHCLQDGCDFTVTITHDEYAAIDAAMQS